MRSVAWVLILTLFASAAPAGAEATAGDAALGAPIPDAVLDATVVVGAASQAAEEEDDDDNPAFIILITFLTINLFVTIDQSTTAEHP